MRITCCDGCGERLIKMAEYATVHLGIDRLDLCYKKCYRHYEDLKREEDALAYEFGDAIKERRGALMTAFREKLKPEGSFAVDLEGFNAPRETANKAQG